MIKKRKINNPKLFQLFAIKLNSSNFWTLSQLYYTFEEEEYLSLTFGFFDILENSSKDLKRKMDEFDLSNPFMVATVNINPLKEWEPIGTKETEYHNINVENNLSKSGWYKSKEIGLYPKLESYFGIYPWDLVMGKTSLTEIINGKTKSKYARDLKDFTVSEIKELGILSLIEYAGRLNEVKGS